MEILLSFKEAVECGASEKELRFLVKINKIKYRKIPGYRGKYFFFSSLLYFFPALNPIPFVNTDDNMWQRNEDIFFDELKTAGSQSKLASLKKEKRQVISFFLKDFEKNK